MIPVLARRELKSLFLSPLAWAVLAVVQLIFGYNFFIDTQNFLRSPDPQGVTMAIVSPMFGWAAILLLFVMPLLTMRLIADERRNQTLSLLFSAPVSMTEIVLGKYMGIVSYLLIIVALLAVMSLSLLVGTTLDFGVLLSAITGLMLLLGTFAAIGLFMSSLTQSPALAAIGTFGVLFSLWLVELATEYLGGDLAAQLSIISHYIPFLQGVINTADVAYYLLLIAMFLVLSIRRLDADRLGS